MQVMLLAYEAPEDFALREDPAKVGSYMGAWYAFSQAMTKAGVNRSGAPLTGPETATMITVREGRRRVEDGPFSDSKEQLGGFFIIDVPDMAAAAEWAARCPAALRGRVEARPIPDYGQGE